MDEVYNLPEPYARFTPQRISDSRNHNTNWVHSLDPGYPQGRAAHRHPYIYDPKVNWAAYSAKVLVGFKAVSGNRPDTG